MPSYRSLVRTPEFTPLFLGSAAQTAAQTVGGLALGTLVYRATGSPLLSAVSMFGPSLAQVLGATVLLSGADRLPPRTALSAIALAFAAGTAVQALPGLPVGAVFAVLLALGLVASLGGGVRWGLLNEILTKDGYLPGRSLFNMMNGLMQVAGFATGGALLAALSPRACLLLSAALHLTAALVLRLGLSARRPRTTGRPSPSATWRANALLWSSRPRRLTYLGLWLPNGLVVGCESLYVPYAPHAAGTLFACGALGMFAGDVTVGRLLRPEVRRRLATPLLLLLAVPFLVFCARPPLLVAAVCVTVASAGFGASLVQQERLMELTPGELAGQALGLHSAGMLTLQGVGAALAGAVAQFTSPAAAMTGTAAGSVCVTLALATAARRTPGRRSPAPPAQAVPPPASAPERSPS
ncbi:Predicted arabinose efflux permease, MFS family [Streptomyces sp. 1222.5]|uniref:MFS transporter n=1 Tax=unclassified Streptomyces TaxID=2593676 RepID=UPI00089CBE72|nr:MULTISPECIES: MFS transporter [unclassified Streptomyces]PKW09333.1 putative MFS family arabinose efflux permease [Streptomyces sp. 5112.2]SEC38195.1 Predicted arabinose efflux permease, MFS family [Streptomyces sp. 1222.5]